MSTKPQATKPVQNMTEINKLLEQATKKLVEANNEIDSLKMQLAQERKSYIEKFNGIVVILRAKDDIIKDLSRACVQLSNERSK